MDCRHIPACSPLPIAVIFSIMVADMFAVFVGIEFLLGSGRDSQECEVGNELGEVEIFGGLKYSGDLDPSYRHALSSGKVGILWLCTSELPANFCSCLRLLVPLMMQLEGAPRHGIQRSIWVGTMIVGPWLDRYMYNTVTIDYGSVCNNHVQCRTMPTRQ